MLLKSSMRPTSVRTCENEVTQMKPSKYYAAIRKGAAELRLTKILSWAVPCYYYRLSVLDPKLTAACTNTPVPDYGPVQNGVTLLCSSGILNARCCFVAFVCALDPYDS